LLLAFEQKERNRRTKVLRKPKSPSASVAKATAREDHLKASRAPTVLHAPLGTLSFDPNEFMHHVESLDLSDEHKLELLHCVWHIMSSFVAWNFSGARSSNSFVLEAESPGMVPSDHSSNKQKELHAQEGVEERIRESD
jgi:hypothetical protein